MSGSQAFRHVSNLSCRRVGISHMSMLACRHVSMYIGMLAIGILPSKHLGILVSWHVGIDACCHLHAGVTNDIRL